ncbi:hypothetical protein [Alicyclobacillus sp. SO9]|uniref:hypothetical protein n=1 Tax=Alicyclobacillus sp. SO9 TaxID=2665646 RepID=UPI0018E7B931|nr:hypothetical protein [Alicyclobacillus sp. SO9]QQE77296.1 hypothetical protein GI364_15160 [Alicyclobacillus sp. SO9]
MVDDKSDRGIIVDEVVDKYTNELSQKRLIDRALKFPLLAHVLLAIYLGVYILAVVGSLILGIGFKIKWAKWNTWGFWGTIIVLFLAFGTIVIRIVMERRKVNKFYQAESAISSTKKMRWREKLDSRRKDEFWEYLKEKELLSIEKMTVIIILLSQRADEQKFQGLFGPGIALALVIPLWSGFINAILHFAKNAIDDFQILVVFGLMIGMVVWLIVLTRSTILDFVERPYRKTKSVIGVLRDFSAERTLSEGKSTTQTECAAPIDEKEATSKEDSTHDGGRRDCNGVMLNPIFDSCPGMREAYDARLQAGWKYVRATWSCCAKSRVETALVTFTKGDREQMIAFKSKHYSSTKPLASR